MHSTGQENSHLDYAEEICTHGQKIIFKYIHFVIVVRMKNWMCAKCSLIRERLNNL